MRQEPSAFRNLIVVCCQTLLQTPSLSPQATATWCKARGAARTSSGCRRLPSETPPPSESPSWCPHTDSLDSHRPPCPLLPCVTTMRLAFTNGFPMHPRAVASLVQSCLCPSSTWCKPSQPPTQTCHTRARPCHPLACPAKSSTQALPRTLTRAVAMLTTWPSSASRCRSATCRCARRRASRSSMYSATSSVSSSAYSPGGGGAAGSNRSHSTCGLRLPVQGGRSGSRE